MTAPEPATFGAVVAWLCCARRLLVAGACLAGGAMPAAEPATIRWRLGESPAVVEVIGADRATLKGVEALAPANPAWTGVLAVFAEQVAATSALPAMLGEWRVAGGAIRFQFRFPPTRGVRYRAEFRPRSGAPLISHHLVPADTTAPSTTVERVYPSGDAVPENQLKFYVHFSAPMSRGGVYEHIQIRDAAGVAVDLAFLELDEELWDPTMTRLTLLIDPGRIKRGVKPLMEVGPVFEPGKTYTLSVAAACRDAAGRPLRESFVKRYAVLPADRTPPDPARWKVVPPTAGTRGALVVEFDEPMDHALALRLIGVARNAGDGGAILAGEPSLERGERQWRFIPDESWAPGAHRLNIATTIEDLAGNNIGKAFDVDVFERVNRSVATPSVAVVFEVLD